MRVSVAALLVTDLVDSTSLVRRLGDLRAAELGALLDARAREVFQRHRGREIDKSDGFLVLFPEVGAAVACALEYHRALQILAGEEGVALSARAGVHLGEVVLRENPAEDVERGAKPMEVEGLSKVVAARLMGLAPGGRTLLSGAAARQARRELNRPDLAWLEHGPWMLKGAGEFEVHEVCPSDARPEGPPTAVAKAWPSGGELALPLDEVLVGRREELATLLARFAGGCRLVTLLGPGGTGKTRLAVRLARLARDSWSDGAFFCDASTARDRDGICLAVARGLGVTLQEGDPVAILGEVLAGRGRSLVVLDNVEQVIDAAAEVLPRWLAAAPQAAFLVTSREALRLHGEERVHLAPLESPAEGASEEEIAASPAVMLLVARVRVLQPDFTLGADNASDLAAIARELDGIPLALELAAARVAAMGPAGVRARMGRRLDLLRSGERDAQARHATLRAAIDWSWSLLTPAERQALAACSTFRGPFDLSQAEIVVGPMDELVVDLIPSLADKSLLRTIPDPQGARFALYETVRELARERLDEGPDALAARQRHGRCFAALGQEESLHALRGPRQHTVRRALVRDRDNLQVALFRAIDRLDAAAALPCAIALLALAETEGPYLEALAVAQRADALPGALPADHARLRCRLAGLLREAGRPEQARAAADGARSLAEQTGEARLIAMAMAQQAMCLAETGALAQARAVQQGALAMAKASGNEWLAARISGQLAISLERQGELDGAARLYAQAEAGFRSLGDARMLANIAKDRGDFLRIRGDLDGARTATQAAIAMADAVGDRRVQATALGNLAEIHLEAGRRDRALQRAREALALHERLGARFYAAHLKGVLAELLADAGRVPEAEVLIDQAEGPARESGTGFLLAVLLVRRAFVERMAGRSVQARGTLELAQGASLDFAHGPQSEFGRVWARLAPRVLKGA